MDYNYKGVTLPYEHATFNEMREALTERGDLLDEAEREFVLLTGKHRALDNLYQMLLICNAELARKLKDAEAEVAPTKSVGFGARYWRETYLSLTARVSEIAEQLRELP